MSRQFKVDPYFSRMPWKLKKNYANEQKRVRKVRCPPKENKEMHVSEITPLLDDKEYISLMQHSHSST